MFLSKIHNSLKITKLIKTFLFSLSLSVFIILPTHANEQTVGDVTIHYSAFNSALISAEVAAQYGITRSAKTGVLNISVLKNNKSVFANVFGHGKNLLGQLKELGFKEIKEDQAIYYIATFNFANAEKLIFDLQIQAEKAGKLLPLKFKQTLYID